MKEEADRGHEDFLIGSRMGAVELELQNLRFILLPISYPLIPLLLPTALLSAVIALSASPVHAAEPKVFRTFMPDAGPSAFGVVLGPELALCYDPLRGGVNQAWLGTLDLAPTLRAKINQPAVVHGEAFYRETTLQPLRVGSSEKAPVRRFKGYRYEKDAVVFEFTLDGVLVRETLRATSDGKGMVREWSVPAGVVLYFHVDAQKAAGVSFSCADEVTPGIWRHEGGDGKVFSMTIQLQKKS